MCAQCHLAPGVDKSELYEGLYPQPPVFHKPEETFWIIKNGLKITEIPARGIYNSDEQISDTVAVLSKLKDMTPEQYNKQPRLLVARLFISIGIFFKNLI